MIVLNQGAELHCEEPGCEVSEPARLVLLASGGLGMVPATESGKRWQFGVGNPVGPIACRCPEHTKQIQAVPTGIRLSEH